MFGKVGYRRRVAASLTEAGNSLVSSIGERVADERLEDLLGLTVAVQADTLIEFVTDQRREATIRGLADAMPDRASAERALRIATWALVLRIPEGTLSHRYPGAMKAAMDAFGIENQWEHRLVHFVPAAVKEMPGFQFDRCTVEGLIAVTTEIDDPKPDPFAVMRWQAESTAAFVGLRAGMDVAHPQPGFSRLSEVESQIKARQAKDSKAE